MDANSTSKIQKDTFIQKQLSDLNIEKIARDTQFYKAAPRKISITNLMLGFFQMALSGMNAYHIWAGFLVSLIGSSFYSVSLWKRMG
jgi:hypothetical protein